MIWGFSHIFGNTQVEFDTTKKTAAFIHCSVTLVPRQPLGWHGRSTGERSSFMAEKLKCSQGEKVSLAANSWYLTNLP